VLARAATLAPPSMWAAFVGEIASLAAGGGLALALELLASLADELLVQAHPAAESAQAALAPALPTALAVIAAGLATPGAARAAVDALGALVPAGAGLRALVATGVWGPLVAHLHPAPAGSDVDVGSDAATPAAELVADLLLGGVGRRQAAVAPAASPTVAAPSPAALPADADPDALRVVVDVLRGRAQGVEWAACMRGAGGGELRAFAAALAAAVVASVASAAVWAGPHDAAMATLLRALAEALSARDVHVRGIAADGWARCVVGRGRGGHAHALSTRVSSRSAQTAAHARRV
jgi:hypothetical protein